jgi:hypothetical protein
MDFTAQQSVCFDGSLCSAIAAAQPSTERASAIDATDSEQVTKTMTRDINEWHEATSFKGCLMKWQPSALTLGCCADCDSIYIDPQIYLS